MNTYTVNGKMITIRTPQGMQTYVWAESEADAIILYTELCRLSVMLSDRRKAGDPDVVVEPVASDRSEANHSRC